MSKRVVKGGGRGGTRALALQRYGIRALDAGGGNDRSHLNHIDESI